MAAFLLLAIALATNQPPAGSIRALGSLGAGDLGISGYYGVEGEGWLSERFGLGGRIVRGEQSTLTFIGPSQIRDATVMEADSIVGVHSGSRTVLFGAGVGAAFVEERSKPGLCLFTCPVTPTPRHSTLLVASLLTGVIVRAGYFALSASARLQLMASGWDLLGTLGAGVTF